MGNEQVSPEFPAVPSRVLRRVPSPLQRGSFLGDHLRVLHLIGAFGLAEEQSRFAFNHEIRLVGLVVVIVNLKLPA